MQKENWRETLNAQAAPFFYKSNHKQLCQLFSILFPGSVIIQKEKHLGTAKRAQVSNTDSIKRDGNGLSLARDTMCG